MGSQNSELWAMKEGNCIHQPTVMYKLLSGTKVLISKKGQEGGLPMPATTASSSHSVLSRAQLIRLGNELGVRQVVYVGWVLINICGRYPIGTE